MKKHLQQLLLIAAMILVPWVTQGQAFTYSCDFDSDSDTAGWVYVNGSQTNQWVVGTATHNSGTKSLYVSNDGGTSNTYTKNTTTFCYAYQEFSLAAGSYALSYDWKAQGESNYDYIRVFLAPSTLTLSAGSSPSGGTSAYTWRNEALPTGCIGLHGPNHLNGQSSFQNFYTDLSITDSGTYRLVFAWANDGSGGSDPAGAIDNIIFSQPTCPRPLAVNYSNLTAHSFDITWEEGGDATEWLIRLSDGSTVVSTYTTTDTLESFTLLNSNTNYTVSVASICGTGDTSLWRSLNILTYCDPMDSLPYVMDFESTPTTSTSSPAFANCWIRCTDADQYYYPYISSSTSYNHTPGGSKYMYWYATSSSSGYGSYTALVMPSVDTSVYPINTLQVSFWAYQSSSTTPIIEVGVMTDPYDINTFESVGTVSITNPTYRDFIVRLDSYTGNGTFVAIKGVVNNYWYLYMDDIKLEIAPDCPRVENYAASNVSTNSATISWSESDTASSWELKYVADGLPEDSIITMTVYDSSFAITGLQPNTTYSVWVTPVCTGLAGTHELSFTTLCLDFDSLPYTYGFEGTSGSSNNPHFGADCWYRITDAYQYYYPYIGYSSTYAHTGNYGLYWYNYYYSGGGYGSHQFVALPKFDSVLYPVNTLQLRFWAKPSSLTTHPIFYVGVLTNLEDPNSFIPVDTVNVINDINWHEYDIPLTNYTGAHGHVAVYTPGISNSWTTYLDDFTLEVAPFCTRPSEISITSFDDANITIDWEDPDTTTSAWQVIYVPAGQDITSDSAVTDYPTAHPYTLSNLEPGTLYDIYVYAECADNNYSHARTISVRTSCTPIDTLPYFYGFEGTSTGSSATIDPCWKKGVLNSTTQYPYPQSVAYSGTRSLYFYGYYSSNYKSWAVMPLFNDSIDDLQVSFKMRASQNYSYYCADLTVGMMTNPYDISTFTPITRCEATSTTVWDSFTVILYGHQSEGRYIAFLAQGRSSSVYYDYVYLDDVVVDRAPQCGPVTDVYAEPSITSAMLAWTPSIRGEYSGATIEYRDVSDTLSAWSTETTTDTYIALTGLNPMTTYAVRITNNCLDGDSPVVTEAFFTTRSYRCDGIDTSIAVQDTIGNSSTTNTYLPIYSFYKYGFSQQIYLDYELGGVSQITGLKVHTANNSQTRYWKIYLSNVTESSVDSWIVPDTQALVWSGSVTYPTNGWLNFEFDAPFTYTGNNVLVTIWDSTGSYVSGNSGYVHNLPDGRQTRYMYRDSDPYQLTNPSEGGTGYALSVRSDMVFEGYGCSTYSSTCAPPPAIIIGYNPNGATIAWAAGSGEGSWNLYYRHPSDASWTFEGEVTSSPYTFTTLTPGTDYQVKIVNVCGMDSMYSIINFFVPCPKIDTLPFFEDFNSYGSGTNVHAPTCWTAGSDYSDSYPYIYSYYNHSGATGGAMYMYNYRGSNPVSNTYFSLPELDSTVAHVNETQVVFYATNGTTSYIHELVVGVCDAPGDMSTFVPIDTVITTYGTWELFEIPFNNYTDSGRYITFNSQPGIGSSYPYSYPIVDDLWLERIPTCQRPDSLQAYNPTTNAVTLQWRSRSEATDFIIEYGPLGFTPGTGTTVAANSNPFTLTGLPANYQGEYYVRNVCSASDTSDYSRSACTFTLNQIPASIPYNCTFEDATEANSWQVNSNNSINWAVGSTMVDSGNYAMYVSPDYGATYGNANFSSIVNATAYRDIDFGPIDSSFTISFRAKVGGTISNTYDGLMVFLVDTTNPVVSSESSITTPWGNVNDLYTVAAVRLDTSWSTYQASFDTIHGVHRVAFFWFNQNTAASYPYLAGPAAVDNIHIDYSPCTRPVNLDVDTTSITSSSARVFWDGYNTNYRVAYREAGTSPSNNTYVDVTGTDVTLTGLTPMATYNVWVQKICGSDSSLFSDGVQFTMSVCETAVDIHPTSTGAISTSYHTPLNNYYRYTATETIIDSAEIGGGYEFNAIRFYYDYTTPSSLKNDVDIYIKPTTKTTFSSVNDFEVVDSTAVLVYSGPLNCEQGWNLFGFNTPYLYDGTGNLMIIVDDNSNNYNGSAYVFRTRSCTGIKTLEYYSDSYHPNVFDSMLGTNYSGTKVSYTERCDLQLVACRSIGRCDQPEITNVTGDYHSVTITWSGDSADYEVNIKETSGNWPATDIAVTGNTYTFTGLLPATDYTFRVRKDCSADSLGYSEWVEGTFTTDSLPCFPPHSLHVTNVTNATATFDWITIGLEDTWEIHVWTPGGIDSIYRVTTRPATVGGFIAGITYSAAVRALCGVDLLEGDWSATINFTTATCPNVANVSAGNVTANSALIVWDLDSMAQSWIVEYGYAGFDQGSGTIVPCTSNSFNATGLECETSYDFYVRAVCGTDWTSENWARVSFTTDYCAEPCDAPFGVTATVNLNTVDVSWTPGEGNTAFEVEYGSRGFSHGSGTTVNATEPHTTLTGLDYNTQYDLYVRALCGADNYSGWSPVTTFTTGTEGISSADGATCTIFPNPATNSTTITVGGVNGKVKIEVVDMNGRTVASETLECNSDCVKTMEVDKLAQGAYFVRISGEQVNMVRKLIVK